MIIKADNIIRFLSAPIGNGNALFFILMYLSGLTNIIFEPWNGSRVWMSLELFSDLYLLCAFLLLIPDRMRHCARIILAVFFYLLSAIDMACYVRLSVPITPTLLQLLLQSNMREAGETLGSYMTGDMFGIPLNLVLLQSAAGIYILSRERALTERLKHICRNIPVKAKATCRVMAFLLFAACFMSSLENKGYMYYRIIRQYSEVETIRVKEFSTNTHFYLPVYRLAFSMAETERLGKEISEFEASMGKAEIDSADHTSPHIIVIIGESYNKHHSPLYGYPKNTAPLQLERQRRGELVAFTDMISTWNMTSESMKNIFSSHCIGQEGSWASAPPFPLIFRNAGYQTTFVSNQYVLGNNGFSDFSEDVFFNNPKTSRMLFDRRNSSTHDYDLSLIADYKALRDDKGAYRLDIFHLLGLHMDFSMRYTPGFRRFTAKDYNRPDLSESSRSIIAAYDNAVGYNDFVLDSILKLFEKEDAIVIHVPDHGERVFDSSREWGRNLTWDKGDISQQFDIPFWIWGSATYRTKHPELWASIVRAADKRGMTDTLPQILYHLAGIHTKWYYPEMDMLNDAYRNDRKRIIRNEKGYDGVMK